MTWLETAPFTGEDASGSSQISWTGRIDITTQVRQVREIVASGMLSGCAFTVAGVLGYAAYTSGDDPVPLLVIGGFFSLSGLFFVAYAIALMGRVISYIYNGEIIIESQAMTIRNAAAGRRTANKTSGVSSPSAVIQMNGYRH